MGGQKTTSTSLIYKDTPVFGFDIGHNSIKVMQIKPESRRSIRQVSGYGYINFQPTSIRGGVIVDVEALAKASYQLFSSHIIGQIDTRRVVASIPMASAYNRVLVLDKTRFDTVAEAVQIEVERYVPIPSSELYYDYEVMTDPKSSEIEVLIMASPRKVIDSYMALFAALGLEVAGIETTISAAVRLVSYAEISDIATLLVDFGSVSTDMGIFDSTLRLTGSVHGGGETVTRLIADSFKVSVDQAYQIKTKDGLSTSRNQKLVERALSSWIDSLIDEIKKMIRFYEERTGKSRKLEQIIILGGGANVPGMSDYLTDKIRVPTRMVDPWHNLSFGKIQPPHQLEKTLYATAAGLALAKSEELI